MLRVSQLSKEFISNNGRIIALKNISFEVEPGEFVVVLGPSGSGKTTLLRAINGLITADTGILYYKGNKIDDHKRLTQLRKHFGMIFQHFNLVENLCVINNVLTGALTETNSFLSLFYIFPKKLKINALQCLNRVQLLDKAYERTSGLSGGQKQRVGIARALMQNPSVILADEPISNLDPMIAFNVMNLLKDICIRDGISILCNLHQVDFALQFADRIIILVDGEAIINKPASELTSDLILQAYKGKTAERGDTLNRR